MSIFIGRLTKTKTRDFTVAITNIVTVLVLIPVMVLWASSLALAQVGSTGRIVGTVQDSSGALIPGATVVARNVGTAREKVTKTNTEGGYVVTDLIPGEYEITVEAATFHKYVQKGVVVHVSRDTGVSATLNVGATTQSVQVTAAGSVVETASGAVQATIETQRMKELPLNGRDALQLMTLQAGVIRTGVTGSGQTQEPLIPVNGARGNANNFLLDGGTNVSPIFSTASPFPNPDALQEFTITTNSADAQYGRGDGATVTAVTKSGTNRLHGALWEFLRNQVLDATPFGAKKTSPFKRNQFGFTLGGPVIKNHTFFFGSYQGTRQRSAPGNVSARVPTTAERGGDLSQFFAPGSIIDPQTGAPFPGNIIPADRISPITAAVLTQLIPAGNATDPVTGVPLFLSTPAIPNDDNQYLARIDHQLSNRDQLFGRFFWDRQAVDSLAGNIPALADWKIVYTNVNQVINWGHTFSPNMYNQFSFAYLRAIWDKSPKVTGSVSWASLGANIPPSGLNPAQTNIQVGGFFQIGAGETTITGTNTYQIQDFVSYSRARHTVRFGAEVTRIQTTTDSCPICDGLGVFSGQVTQNPFADFLLGQPGQFLQFANVQQRRWQPNVSAFIQDDLQVRSNLTLNLGLRYQPLIFPSEYGGEATRFRPGKQSTIFPTAPKGIIFVGDAGFENGRLTDNQLAVLEPRIGLAWDPFRDHKSSVRAGFGMYHTQNQMQGFDYVAAPFSLPIVFNVPVGGIADPYSGKTIDPTLFNKSKFSPESERINYPFDEFGTYSCSAFCGFPAHMPVPTSLQWNLTLQREIVKDTVLGVSYIGTHGYNEWNFLELNPAIFVPGNDPSTGEPLSTSGNVDSRRLTYPGFGALDEQRPVGTNDYHGVQFSVEHRYTKGFAVQANYTIAKNLSIARVFNVANQTGPVNPFDPRHDRGPSQFDIPQRFVASVIWELPWYRNQSGAVGHVLGGWEVTAIPSVQGGVPLTIGCPCDNSRTGLGIDRADLVPGQDPNAVPGGRIKALGNLWFNPNAFQPNAVGTFGNSARGVLRGPGSGNVDFGFYKNIRISESHALQFRSEWYNGFNHPNFNGPNTNIFDKVNFGRLTSKGGVRVIEFALKYSF
jgi:hypothetical protein